VFRVGAIPLRFVGASWSLVSAIPMPVRACTDSRQLVAPTSEVRCTDKHQVRTDKYQVRTDKHQQSHRREWCDRTD
jgi:hypothetical protein